MTLTERDERAVLAKALRGKVDELARRLAPVYRALRWTWVDRDDYRYTPGERDIRSALLQQIDSAEVSESGGCSTGGLRVEFIKGQAYMQFEVGYAVDGDDGEVYEC